jgi:hypothetical protein
MPLLAVSIQMFKATRQGDQIETIYTHTYGDSLLLAVFLITEVARIFGPLFPTVKVVH